MVGYRLNIKFYFVNSILGGGEWSRIFIKSFVVGVRVK